MKREQNGKEISLANYLRMRLLSAFEPEAFPMANVLRTDSTSRGQKEILFNCERTTLGTKSGRVALLSSNKV